MNWEHVELVIKERMDGSPTYGGEGAALNFESNSVAYVHAHSLYVGWKITTFLLDQSPILVLQRIGM